MFSVKKILKRTLGGLKMAAVYGPFVVLVGGGAAGLGLGIASGVQGGNTGVIEDYKNSEVYISEFINDSNQLKEKFDQGEISEIEYVDALKEMAEDDYAKEVMDRDLEGNEEWKGNLKSINALGIAGIACGVSALIAGIVSLVWIKTDIADDIYDSALEDFEWEPSKKIEKRPEIIIKEDKKEDISSDEQELGSLDDYLEKLQ